MSKINTRLVHGVIDGDERTGAVNVPIYQTSTFKQPEFAVRTGYEYSRTNNPTREALEKQIADLEGGKAGFAFASGMAAIDAVLRLYGSGKKVIIPSDVYGGTFRILDKVFSRFGLGYKIVDTSDLKEVEKSITPDVSAFLIESPANPLLTITDISELSKLAHRHDVHVIVDNTFMTPYLQRPIELGADIVVHSATKYIGGHSDIIAGLAVVNNEDIAKRLHTIQNATGGILQPFDSFLALRGIKTLSVRMERHVLNAKHIAEFLSEHPGVSKIHYPGLKTDPGYKVNKKQASAGGGMISFELKNGYDHRVFVSSTKLFALGESLGGVESLICHPASMTHASIPADLRINAGINDGLIRLSVGIEDKEDLIEDLEKAFERSKV